MEPAHQSGGKKQNGKQDKSNDQEREDQEDQSDMSPFFIQALAVCRYENHRNANSQRDQHGRENRHQDLPKVLRRVYPFRFAAG